MHCSLKVPIFHELLNLKLKKLVKSFFKEQEKRYTRGKHPNRDQRSHDRARAQAIKRLEKICLGRSAVAQGAAVCATLMKDLHIDEHFATGTSSVLSSPELSAKGGGQLDELPISRTPELPFCRLVAEGHHFHPWAPVAMNLVQRTQCHIQQSAAEALAEEHAAAAEDAALEAGEVVDLLRTPVPTRRMSPVLSPFGNHKVRKLVTRPAPQFGFVFIDARRDYSLSRIVACICYVATCRFSVAERKCWRPFISEATRWFSTVTDNPSESRVYCSDWWSGECTAPNKRCQATRICCNWGTWV